jgi:hypothetical protein
MARAVCIMLGCEYLNNARGMCRTHYGQWLRENKDALLRPAPMVVGEMTDEQKEDYWQFVRKELKLV